MNQANTTRLSSRLRMLFGLALLIGLCTLTGGLTRPAHAQSTLRVTNCSSDAQLQAAVTQANRDDAGDVITFACSGDIKLTSTLTISGSMTLDGRGQSVTLDGGGSVQILYVNGFYVNGGVSLTLNALTIAHGVAAGDANTTFLGNVGGGLNNDGGTVSISNSTFAYNSATGGFGGGLSNSLGTLSISNSTIANNSATYGGGGIYNLDTVNITNSTIANNSGGGIYNDCCYPTYTPTLTISRSIVAANAGGDCFNLAFNDTLADQGYNLSSDSSCGFTGTGSLQNTNPKLGPLASNGGPTQTIALLNGSPASDAIPLTSALCPKTDQRGHKRPDNLHESACDIGAYES